jgi:WD repeat and FYVE domain-containing protein 3
MSTDDVHVDQDQPQDSQNLLRLLEDNEKIGHLFRCARVEGLGSIDGLLLFGIFQSLTASRFDI